MDKREFIIAYVLNRANAHTGDLDGPSAVNSANAAWDRIEKYAPQNFKEGIEVLVKDV